MNKYIIFSYDYPPNNGGISRLCGEIRKELLRRGENVYVVACTRGETTIDIERVSGRRGLLDIRMRNALKRAYQPGDVVITDTWHPAGMLALTVTRDVFMLAHGAEFLPSTGLKNTILWNLYRKFILRKAKGVVANSHYTDGLVCHCSPKANSIANPLAIDANYFHPTADKNTADNTLRICSLSRLQQFKGHDFVLRTIASLPNEYKSRLLFEIGGKGDYKATLEQLTQDLGLSAVVKFLGFMPDEDVLDFYSRNDLFILCTREEHKEGNVEGFGLVFTEAQACGTAVIGTRTGGIPDAIHEGRGGWLVIQDNEDQLRTLLMQLIDNKSKTQQAGAMARQRVIEECNWETYCDKLLNFIDHV